MNDLPSLEKLDRDMRALFLEKAQEMTVPAGIKVFETGSACAAFLMVVSGSVRVQMLGESGREIVLYRVEDGQTCILTTACLLSNEAYNAEALTETETTALALPVAEFHKFLGQSDRFRQMVFESYSQRISNLVLLVEEVAFRRLDVRLAEFLVAHQDGAGLLNKTHQELAIELGTAREVISRQLKEFERRDWVKLTRGQVQVLDKKAFSEFILRHCD